MSSISNRLFRATEVLRTVLVTNAPYDTGNLAMNAIQLIQNEPGIFGVVIGGELAPYAKYTNEPWINRGQNPNEGWIQSAVNQALPMIKDILNGVITTDELEKFLEEQNQVLARTQQLKAENKQSKVNKLLKKLT